MHFDATISLGNILLIATVLGVAWKFARLVQVHLAEHEMLIDDYCERHGIEKAELLTRIKTPGLRLR